MKPRSINILIFSIFVLLTTTLPSIAQTTAFNYQGRLTDGGNPANGNFLMQFKLFDAVSGGAQIGSTLNDVAVVATNGTFSVRLDFGSAPLTGANRWIEIAVRRNAGESYVPLTPREQVVSAPYAVKSLSSDTAASAMNATNAATAANASQLGGLPPARYVQTDASGNVGIGTSPGAGSKLTVGGQLQLTSGAVKFPDSTTQSTAGLTSVMTSSPLTGNGTTASPLGIVSPLPVRDTENPARQPVFFSRSGQGDAYTVPGGKRLVIEFVSTTLTLPSSTPMPFIQIGGSGTAGTHLISAEGFRDGATSKTWIFSKAVRLYVPSGGVVFVSFSDSPTLQNPVFFTGYLLDIP